MPALVNERHEMFCHFVARGNLPEIAYVAAGYERNPEAAHILMGLPLIADRIAELRPSYHQKYRTRVPGTVIKKLREADARS